MKKTYLMAIFFCCYLFIMFMDGITKSWGKWGDVLTSVTKYENDWHRFKLI